MKLQEDVLTPPVPGILGDQAQVTESVDLGVQFVISTDQGEFATVSFLDPDPDPDPGPVLHIVVEILLKEAPNPIGQLALKGHQEDRQDQIEKRH